ncbi:MAG: methylmalonyl-CoA mutase family protein [Bacteroidia bacterium]
MAKHAFFSEFTSPDQQAWTEKASRDLKGKPLSKLDWQCPEGFELNPYPFDAPVPDAWHRGNAFNAMDSGWQAVQPINVSNPAADAILLEAIEHGIPAFLLYAETANALPANFHALWDLIDVSRHAIHLAPGQDLAANRLAEALITKAVESGQAHSLTGNIFVKPGQELPSISLQTPWFRTAGTDLVWLEARGASAATQLAVALSHTVGLLEKEPDKNLFAQRLAYRFGIGGSFWVEVAKFRAFRMLIARVLEVMGVTEEHALSPFVLAQTGLFNKSRYDAHTNMLRATTEAVSASVAGVHAIASFPHNRLFSEASVADARLGRNILQLMRHESYLHRVADPAGGSRYAEQLTEKLTAEAWRQFQEIEALGGYGKAYNWLDQKMGEAMAWQHQAAATRRRSYVGVTNYPNPDESLQPEIPDKDLRPIAAYERLRAAVEKRPVRPKAFILMYGDRLMRNARSTFARNVLGILGLELIENQESDNWNIALQELEAARPDVVCLCAADEDYSPEKINAIRAVIPEARLLVAGRNQEGLEADYYIFMGADVLGVLTSLASSI